MERYQNHPIRILQKRSWTVEASDFWGFIFSFQGCFPIVNLAERPEKVTLLMLEMKIFRSTVWMLQSQSFGGGSFHLPKMIQNSIGGLLSVILSSNVTAKNSECWHHSTPRTGAQDMGPGVLQGCQRSMFISCKALSLDGSKMFQNCEETPQCYIGFALTEKNGSKTVNRGKKNPSTTPTWIHPRCWHLEIFPLFWLFVNIKNWLLWFFFEISSFLPFPQTKTAKNPRNGRCGVKWRKAKNKVPRKERRVTPKERPMKLPKVSLSSVGFSHRWTRWLFPQGWVLFFPPGSPRCCWFLLVAFWSFLSAFLVFFGFKKKRWAICSVFFLNLWNFVLMLFLGGGGWMIRYQSFLWKVAEGVTLDMVKHEPVHAETMDINSEHKGGRRETPRNSKWSQ